MAPNQTRNRVFMLGGLSVALLIGVFLSPFASKSPDGLDRVSEDLKFNHKEAQVKPAQKLPFYAVFDQYALRGVPGAIATPLAGLAGTLGTFGLAWGIGKLVTGRSGSNQPPDQSSQSSD